MSISLDFDRQRQQAAELSIMAHEIHPGAGLRLE
jgi:hypothetical protein